MNTKIKRLAFIWNNFFKLGVSIIIIIIIIIIFFFFFWGGGGIIEINTFI